MCVSVQHLALSKSRYFNPDKTIMTHADVPCGHCIQCTTTAKNDLFLRIRAEYLDCIRSGGAALFLTFTYDEQNVPYKSFTLSEDGFISLSRVPRYSPEYNVLMCFDKSHITKYLKSLRKAIAERYYGPDESSLASGSLRYICVPEYGTRFTQRPHYHAIFFLSSDLWSRMSPGMSPKNDDFKTVSMLMDLFSEFWPYGMVSASKRGLFIVSEACSSYVSKYVCKNSDLLKFSRFRNFFDFICNAFYDRYGEFCSQGTGALRTPFGHMFTSPMSFFLYYCRLFECSFYVVKSLNFGLSLSSCLPTSSPEAFVAALDRGVPVYSRKSSDIRYLKYPRYVVHKLLYNHRKDGTYYLNDFGLRTIDHLRLQSISDSVRCVKSFDWSLMDTVPLDAFHNFFSKYGYSVESLPKLRDLLLRRADQVFVYNIFMRYRAFDSVSFSSASQLFTDYCKGLLPLKYLVVALDSIIVDSEPITDCLPRLSITSQAYIEACSTDHFVPVSSPGRFKYFDRFYRRWCDIFDMLLDFWSCLTTYCRASLLYEYEAANIAAKQLSDVLNLKSYVIQKKCS